MEETDQEVRTASPDIPKVPIKTYHWEDVRRSRKRGAYPWTHLTKPPYDEEADPDEYTMDAFRRSRSTSTLGKSESREITDIEEEFENGTKMEEDSPEDKENQRIENVQSSTSKIKMDEIPITTSNGSKDRAKSEEPARKRKLSVDSSYSRISLPKLRLMEKLKNVKSRFPKIPKRTRSNASDTKEIKKPKTATSQKDPLKPTLNNNSPVYIHIPLKPPPGQTDEFSKYEFESPSHSPKGSSTHINEIIETKRKTSLLDILTQIKIVHEQHVARRSSQTADEMKKTIEEKSKEEKIDDKDESVRIQEITADDQTSSKEDDQQPTVEIEESGSTTHTDFDQSQRSDKVTIEEIVDEVEKPKTPEPATMEVDNSSVDDNISQCLDKDDQYEVIPEPSSAQPSTTKTEIGFKPDPEKLRKLEGALSKWKKQVPKTTHLELPHKETQPVRARSEEPKPKRRSSIDSSYSRKSLSKLAFLKKLKQAKEKIKLPKFPSFSKFDKKESTKTKEKKDAAAKPVDAPKKHMNPDKPVYIHIPLKPPPGETDEFSYLVNEPMSETVQEKDESAEKEENEDPESPEPDSGNNVQLIILTPPSDDEILDSAGPETPSETDQKFFESLKIEDLKTLAKNAVNTVYPEMTKLETVEEDEGSDTQETIDEDLLVVPKHQILVDEEDGLKLSETAIAMINEELEKEYKQQAMSLKSIIKSETSPVLKKKVSFKRKSRQEGGDRIYEDVQLNKNVTKTGAEDSVVAHSVVIPLESFQSMSVDEEKSYLDKQVIKTTSLEDDYNKWSKSNDHEYEPIDPPPEVVTIKSPPIIHDNAPPPEVETSFDEERLKHKDEGLSVQEMQQNIEDRFFQQPAELPRPNEKSSSTLQKPSAKVETPKAKKKLKVHTGKNFNETLKSHADKIKSKIQSIKRPNISLPQRPTITLPKRPNITLPQRPKLPTAKLKKPNFKKPNFKMPKLPDRPTINLPSFSFTRKSSKDAWRERQFSTESNAGDSKKKIFDFRTYPRMFDKSKKKEKQESLESSTLPPEFATVPRTSKKSSRWPTTHREIGDKEKTPDVIRIPLHPEEEDRDMHQQDQESLELPRQESLDTPQEIEIEEDNEAEYKQEDNEEPLFSKDFLKRWEHGHFHDDSNISNDEHRHEFNINYEPEDTHIHDGDSFDITPPKQHSSESLSEHRQGVLEEIDSDEFFLRQKGISQEDIEVGKYLSSEIREAFRNPIPQFQSEDREYDMEMSDQSEPIRETPRRKPLRKPKRKKTPHVSKEQISFDRESYNTEPDDYLKTSDEPIEVTPPVRPKRRNSKKKKKSPISDVIPYQETIPIHDQGDEFIHPDYTRDMLDSSEILPDNILSNDMQYHYQNEFPRFYENQFMKGIEQPEITVSHTYYRFEPYSNDQAPIPPIRRQRSSRSLSVSDQDSLLEEDQINRDIPEEHILTYLQEHEYIIPTPEPPIRPRRTRSRTRSQSVLQQEDDGMLDEEKIPVISDLTTPNDQVEEMGIMEAPCVIDLRDASGYAIIDKTKPRDPPLPPSRFDDAPKTPPRRRRNKKTDTNDKFATVPRLSSDPPRRPLRNYSTLRGTNLLTDEEKENLNLAAGHLQSGEVIQKMRDRPLPAPPRPPRKSRSVLNNISHQQNIQTDSQEDLDKLEAEILLDIEDQIVPYDNEETVTHGTLILQTAIDPSIIPYAEVSKTNKSSAERIIPITQEFSETVKQSSEQDQQIPQDKDSEDDDFSVIPEEFKKFKSPEDVVISDTEDIKVDVEVFQKPEMEDSEVPEEFHRLKDYSLTVTDEEKVNKASTLMDDQEINILKAQKLQVCDLDVDKLRVKELQASKIIVSELDGVSLQVSEINSKCGNLIVSGIDLPPNLIQEMLHKLQLAASEGSSTVPPLETSGELHHTQTDSCKPGETPEDEEQKKTLTEETEEKAPPVPPRYDSRTNLIDEEIEPVDISTAENQKTPEEMLQPPTRPPRRSSQVEKLNENVESETQSTSNLEDVQVEPTETENVLKKTSINFQPEQNIFLKSEEKPPTPSKSDEEPPPLPPKQITTQTLSKSDEEPPHKPLGFERTVTETPPKSDEEPPPRPPEPVMDTEVSYMTSQPPPSFFALKSPHLKEFFDEDIPLPPRRKRHHRPPPISRSSSDDVAPAPRRHHRPPEQSIPQLTGQLVRLCAVESERSIKRLISHITNNVLQNADGKQDLHVIILLLLILIAGLLLLSDPKVTIHQNHWDFFNPPTDL